MNKKKLLIFCFVLAGLILAWFLFLRLTPEPDPEAVIREFFAAVNTGDAQKVTELLAPESAQKFRWPANALGRAIHENLSVQSVENIVRVSETEFNADVTFESLAVRQVMSRAAFIWLLSQQERTDSPDITDADADLAEIYNKILLEKPLPKAAEFRIIRLRYENNSLRILLDGALESLLDGNLTENLEAIQNLMSGSGAE